MPSIVSVSLCFFLVSFISSSCLLGDNPYDLLGRQKFEE